MPFPIQKGYAAFYLSSAAVRVPLRIFSADQNRIYRRIGQLRIRLLVTDPAAQPVMAIFMTGCFLSHTPASITVRKQPGGLDTAYTGIHNRSNGARFPDLIVIQTIGIRISIGASGYNPQKVGSTAEA